MYLEQLELSNFRNYKKITLKLSAYINIFYGDNAQGKTNLLEAIYFLGLSKSQRTSDNSSNQPNPLPSILVLLSMMCIH